MILLAGDVCVLANGIVCQIRSLIRALILIQRHNKIVALITERNCSDALNHQVYRYIMNGWI